MRTETSNMKPNEPSRTALIIARQRAAHQVLDHGSILYDPFAMKILREDEKEVLQFANGLPLPHERSVSMRWTTPRRRHGNASDWLKLKSHFRHGLLSCQSISSGTMW